MILAMMSCEYISIASSVYSYTFYLIFANLCETRIFIALEVINSQINS